MKIVTVIGARPQFIKASAVCRAISRYNRNADKTINEILLHTGQHYDKKMSDIFFDQLEIPKPHYNLGIKENSHGAMTGKMLMKTEEVLLREKPDLLLVYGDTNSTLAGALAAVKLHIPVAHVEAGLRSFNMLMPEEINRILTDRISTLLFCPTSIAVENLVNEGLEHGVHDVGDVMYDMALFCQKKAKEQFKLQDWRLDEGNYILCTVHRAENTDDPNRLKSIFSALQSISSDVEVVIPLHPRTYNVLKKQDCLHYLNGLHVMSPMSYLEMTRLQMSALAILTDSGGVQKEAFFHQVPCLTLRDETEWVETIELGRNILCGADQDRILDEWKTILHAKGETALQNVTDCPYGDGTSGTEIVRLLSSTLKL